MSKYTKEQFEADKLVITLCLNSLSRRVAGESGENLAVYAPTAMGIAKRLEVTTPDIAIAFARMFVDIAASTPLGGFKCTEYEKLLKATKKRLQAMMFFRRKQRIACFEPLVHRQPCYCARLAAFNALTETANTKDDDEREMMQAKINGILALDVAREMA